MVSSKVERNSPDLICEVLEDKDCAAVYLQHSWFGSAQVELRKVFRASGLSLVHVAERMDVSVRTAKRIHDDLDGNVTFAKYAAFMAACGVGILNIDHAPIEEVRQAALAARISHATL